MRHRGDVPRPRVRFENTPDDLIPLLQGLSGGTEEFGTDDDTIHPPDYDLLVTFGVYRPDERRGRSGTFHILAFSAARLTLEERFGQVNVSYYGESVAREVVVPDNVAQDYPSLARLARETVVENLPDQKIYWERLYGKQWSEARESAETINLVEVGTGNHARPVAILNRTNGGTWTLALPSETSGHERWVVAFLRHLRDHDPENFPADPDWRRQLDWAPPRLAEALDSRAAVEREREEFLSELAQRAAEIDLEVERLAAEAASGVQRLLTAQGGELVEAVADVLTDLGFEVEDRDDAAGEGEPKLEDLRLRDPDEPDWVCLVEVKGYTKGAKANDVQQVALRPVRAFVDEFGRYPGGLWHIVNTWIGTSPATRGVALQGDPSIENLASNGGTFIDTRDLFEVWRRVQLEPELASAMRAKLRTTTGRFAL